MNAFVLRRAATSYCCLPLARLAGLLLICTPALLGMASCQSGRLGRVPAAYRDYHEAGIAVIGPKYGFDATTKVRSNRPVLLTLKSNEARKYKGGEIYPDFRAYLKPGRQGEIDVNFSEPEVEVHGGWALLVGSSPVGQTTRVRAVGEGTTMIIEIDDTVSPAMHRVYLVAEDDCVVHIEVPPYGSRQPDLTIGTYGEVQDIDSAAWEFKGKYANDPARADFVKKALEEGRPIVGK